MVEHDKLGIPLSGRFPLTCFSQPSVLASWRVMFLGRAIQTDKPDNRR